MDTIIDFYNQHSNFLEPLIFILIFSGVARTAFRERGANALVIGIGLLLSFSFIRWAKEHDWQLMDWGVFGFIIITLAVVVTAVNFISNTKPQRRQE